MLSCLEVLSINTSIYFVHLQSLLKITPYASEVWDNCRQTNCNRLEKIQIEAARIVTGLSIYGSLDSIYKETGGKHYVQEGKLNNCYFFFLLKGTCIL
jgi:hypothetical protein